jgi:hypothetical protein
MSNLNNMYKEPLIFIYYIFIVTTLILYFMTPFKVKIHPVGVYLFINIIFEAHYLCVLMFNINYDVYINNIFSFLFFMRIIISVILQFFNYNDYICLLITKSILGYHMSYCITQLYFLFIIRQVNRETYTYIYYSQQFTNNKLDKKNIKKLVTLIPPEDNLCSICILDDSEEKEWINLSCKHKFHQSCITPWLVSNNTCPYCRNIENNF